MPGVKFQNNMIIYTSEMKRSGPQQMYCISLDFFLSFSIIWLCICRWYFDAQRTMGQRTVLTVIPRKKSILKKTTKIWITRAFFGWAIRRNLPQILVRKIWNIYVEKWADIRIGEGEETARNTIGAMHFMNFKWEIWIYYLICAICRFE